MVPLSSGVRRIERVMIMITILAIMVVVLLVVLLIVTLFTGNLTVEQLIAVILAMLLVNGVLDEIRAWKARKQEKAEDGHK